MEYHLTCDLLFVGIHTSLSILYHVIGDTEIKRIHATHSADDGKVGRYTVKYTVALLYSY